MSESEYGDGSATAGVFIWLVRLGLVAVTAFTLWGANEAERGTSGAFDAASFWRSEGLFAAAGAAFCLAVRIPFPRPRVAIGRLVFVLAGLLPAIHRWLLTLASLGGPAAFHRTFWFDEASIVQVGAALAGVGFASAIGSRRGRR